MSGVVSSSSAVNTVGSGFSYPGGVAVDSFGNLFVADSGNNAVKEIVAVSGVVSSISTVNTVGSGFNGPEGVAVDSVGDVFVADYGNNAVRQIVAVSGSVSSSSTVNTLGGGFNRPYGVAVDSAGNVFVADYYNNAVEKIVPGGVNFGSVPVATITPTTLSLTFTFDTAGTIGLPAVLTQGATGLDFTDAGTGTCTTNGTSHIYSTGDTCTVDVTFTPQLSGVRYGAVTLSSSGTTLATAYINGKGTGPQVSFSPGTQVAIPGVHPASIAVDRFGNVYVGNTATNSVQKETLSSGTYTLTTLVSGLSNPNAVAIDGAGNLYISDAGNHRVLKETLGLNTYTQSGLASSLTSPSAVAVDGSGNVYILDSRDNIIILETLLQGSYTRTTVSITGLINPSGLAVDGSGNLYIADTNQNLILLETATAGGYVQSVVVGSGLSTPYAVAVDGNGNVFISDSFNHRVLEAVPSAGTYTLSVVATTGLGITTSVAIGGNGYIYVGDSSNNRVLKLDITNPPSLTFPLTDLGATSASQTVTVANVGTTNLSFPIPGSGNDPSISPGFTLSGVAGTPCPVVASTSFSAGSLLPETSCTLQISFVPTAVGSTSGSVVLVDTNLNAPAPNYSTQTVR